MKTAKDFFEDIKKDQDLAATIGEALKAKLDGKTDDDAVASAFSEVAADNGYELTPEEVKTYGEDLSEDLSEEELGKVAGGSLLFALSTGLSMLSLFSATIYISDKL